MFLLDVLGHIWTHLRLRNTPRKGIWGTPKGPLGHPETATVGLDDLQQRCQQALPAPLKWMKW